MSLPNLLRSSIMLGLVPMSVLMNDDDNDNKRDRHTSDGVSACIVPCFAFYPALSA